MDNTPIGDCQRLICTGRRVPVQMVLLIRRQSPVGGREGALDSVFLCAFFALFWTLRLIAGTFVFDMRPYLTSRYRRLGYHAINIVFAYLPIVYALAASRPHWLPR